MHSNSKADTTKQSIILIHKDMMILEVVKKYPETMSVFIDSKLQCFSCMMSPFETLEEGAIGHGWTQQDLNELVLRLNEKVRERATSCCTTATSR